MISEIGTYKWEEIDHTFSATEATFPMPSWGKARRFVIVRKRVHDEMTQQISYEDDYFKYEYQAIVTNIDYLTSGEIFQEYNQRGISKIILMILKKDSRLVKIVNKTRKVINCSY